MRAPLDTGLYSAEQTERTYEALLERANQHLSLGQSVVIDASWTSSGDRQRARDVAIASRAPIIELRCVVPNQVAARRAEARLQDGTDASDAGASVARALADAAEPWPESTDLPTDAPVQRSRVAPMRSSASATHDLVPWWTRVQTRSVVTCESPWP